MEQSLAGAEIKMGSAESEFEENSPVYPVSYASHIVTGAAATDAFGMRGKKGGLSNHEVQYNSRRTRTRDAKVPNPQSPILSSPNMKSYHLRPTRKISGR